MPTQLSPIGRYLRELAWESMRCGHTTFSVDFTMFMDGRMGLARSGVTFADELEEFCWLTESSYWILGAGSDRRFTVKVPDFVFNDYWLDRLSLTIDAMEGYAYQ